MPTTTARPRQSSPMPGPWMMVPSRRVLTSVPSGNTVSRCAAITRCGRGARPGRSPRHVSDAIDADVLESELLEHLLVEGRALFFLEWRGLDFADADLIVEQLRLVGLRMGEGGLDGAVLQQALADVGRTLLGKGCRHDGK